MNVPVITAPRNTEWVHEDSPATWWRYEAEIRRVALIKIIRLPLEHYPWNYRD